MNNWKQKFLSDGHIEPWGRDFWNENPIGGFIYIAGGTLVVVAIIIGILILII